MRPSAHLFAVNRVHLLGIGRTARGETDAPATALPFVCWATFDLSRKVLAVFFYHMVDIREEDLTNIKLVNPNTRTGYYME